jgi:hypothetical protein
MAQEDHVTIVIDPDLRALGAAAGMSAAEVFGDRGSAPRAAWGGLAGRPGGDPARSRQWRREGSPLGSEAGRARGAREAE